MSLKGPSADILSIFGYYRAVNYVGKHVTITESAGKHVACGKREQTTNQQKARENKQPTGAWLTKSAGKHVAGLWQERL